MNDIPKFVFNCTDCGKCCERNVEVYLKDIEDWIEHGLIYKVLPELSLSGDYGSLTVQLDKKTQDGMKICAFLDTEKNQCSIEDNKPLSCRAFPLGHSKEHFIVVDMDCPGLGQGSMTAESLKNMRMTAKAEFQSKSQTEKIMPVLQALFIKLFTMESQKAMEELEPEQREELEKILRKK